MSQSHEDMLFHLRGAYKIVFQWRNPAGCVGDPMDWRSWRCFGAWPIVFPSRQEAEEHLFHGCGDMFRGMRHLSKPSASCVPITYNPIPKAKGQYGQVNRTREDIYATHPTQQRLRRWMEKRERTLMETGRGISPPRAP